MPEEQLGKLELFQAAFRAMEIFWGADGGFQRHDVTMTGDGINDYVVI